MFKVPAVLLVVLIALAQPVAAQDFDVGKAAYDRGDYVGAWREWRPLAEQGDARAQSFIGAMYFKGYGVVQNYGKAAKWYRKAAEQGSAWAQAELGTLYRRGQGVVQDDGEAVKWYRKAVEQGSARAQADLGTMYRRGQGVVQDYGKAAKWYRKAAEQGSAWAQAELGTLYRRGQGVVQDDGEAVKWYRKAAARGFAAAQSNLGWMYQFGHGIAQDDSEAVKWYHKAAEQGVVQAQSNLGSMYQFGLGVAQNYGEALMWYRKAADQGHARAQTYLGAMYQNGLGVAQDYGEALKWYRKAKSSQRIEKWKTPQKLALVAALEETERKVAEAKSLRAKGSVASSQPIAKAERDRAVQKKLMTLGFYKGNIDGIIGPASKAAISAWQAARGHSVTGLLNDAQFTSLEREKVQVAAPSTAQIPPRAPSTNKYAVAVILGNHDYGDPVPDVDYAANDADAMRRFVIEHLGYRDGNIIDLRDASQTELIATFGNENNHHGKLWRLARAGKSDVTVFYSGHGVPGLRDKKGYLLPVDADPDAVELNGYPLDWLLNNLAKINARSMTVYLDACFSGESPKGMLIQAVSGLSIEPRMPAANSGMTVITAATGDQVASWDKKAKHGLFTKHLLDALSGAADKGDYGNGDGKVTVGEVKRYLDDEMTYAAQRNYGRVQTATVKGDPDTVLAVVR
jgi:TPR repeat protein/peptidoglycan hydrolase-like protein with peptidoglycan-binding domain